MAQEKMNIDEAKAKMWISDVEDEISQVKAILRDASNALIEVPGENDTIIQGLVRLGEIQQKAWDTITDKFEKAGEEVKRVIGIISNAISEAVDDVDALARKRK